MSKTFVYDRFDCTNGGSQFCYGCYTMDASPDGDYVRAEDAINREAVLQAEIRTLQAQLKEARLATIERCAAECDRIVNQAAKFNLGPQSDCAAELARNIRELKDQA